MSTLEKTLCGLVLAVACLLGGGAWLAWHDHQVLAKGRAEVQAQWDKAAEAARTTEIKRQAADAQRAGKAVADFEAARKNLETALEKKQNEIRLATAYLHACRVGGAVRLLNDAAASEPKN